MSIEFRQTIPIFRIFSVEKAKEFYVDFLGFRVDWEHRFEENTPLYMQVSRGNMALHVSEHHGDGSPGAAAMAWMTGVEELHGEISARNYKYLRPGVEPAAWDPSVKVMGLIDPFGNRLSLCERAET